jgi:hypothetical protein
VDVRIVDTVSGEIVDAITVRNPVRSDSVAVLTSRFGA